MKFIFWFFQLFSITVYSQYTVDSISNDEVKNIISVLASDSLHGRGNYTSDLSKAANFISNKFKDAHLDYLPKYNSYYHPFTTKKLSPLYITKDSVGNYNPEEVLLNVIGVLPGKSLADEVIIFSAHYDHLGSESPHGIFKGANDNASGTTALLILAGYYAKRADNERTIIFCAFSGEELGLFGSTVFVKNLIAEKVKAVINIEMIGRHRGTGKNKFFITGAYHSNLENIFKKNLKGNKIKIVREPDFSKELFSRSDNYPFAKKGIPAHSIMSSDDDDFCYHRTCDDLKSIDIPNMTEIIKGIIAASTTLISGIDTPSRIKL